MRDEVGDHFTLGEAQARAAAIFDVILLRQDPPFDIAYITSTHFLERIHPKTLVVNDPASVRNAPEKLFVLNFPQLMPPTLISRDLDEINSFRDEHGAVVMKPLHGHGGAAVFRVMPQDMNFGSLFDMFSVTFREPWVIQRFLPEVKHGDKRIILVDGEFAGAVNRVPAPDDLRSNMVRGGAAQATELSEREREICATLGPALRERGLLFVGIDVIDGNLTEINVTCPTGIRAIASAQRPGCGGKDLGHHRGEARRKIISLALSANEPEVGSRAALRLRRRTGRAGNAIAMRSSIAPSYGHSLDKNGTAGGYSRPSLSDDIGRKNGNANELHA